MQGGSYNSQSSMALPANIMIQLALAWRVLILDPCGLGGQADPPYTYNLI